jgi:hypothetical protein
MERDDKKGNWKETMRRAEVSPSASVWQGIEMQLDKDEVAGLRKTVFYYKYLAAACVAFALVAFGVSSWVLSSSGSPTTEQLSVSDRAQEPVTGTGNGNVQLPEQSNPLTSEKSTFAQSRTSFRPKSSNSSFQKNQVIDTRTIGSATPLLSLYKKEKNTQQAVFEIGRGEEGAREQTQTNQQAVKVGSPVIKEENKTEALAFSDAMPAETKKEGKKQTERFWTSVGFAAGSFNNTTPSSSTAPASVLQSSAAGQTAASESNSPGHTYAFNVGIGTKVSKRWLVQGGMSYITQLSDYTANTVVATGGSFTAEPTTFAAASINEFKKQEADNTESSILTSTPYTVNNNIQIISFPVQAGYVVFERKMALQINSGISTDLFLQNTITPNTDNLEKTTQGRGDDSPYRPVNFSGLFGTELSYKFGENYRVSLSPGLRYPFNSMYKNELGVKSTPLTFDVALRFRYILK